MSTIESPVLVLNPHVAPAQSAEPQRPKVHVPDPVVDLLQAHILTDADGRHVHPARVPANAAVGADGADFEPIGVLERRQSGPAWAAATARSTRPRSLGRAPRAAARG